MACNVYWEWHSQPAHSHSHTPTVIDHSSEDLCRRVYVCVCVRARAFKRKYTRIRIIFTLIRITISVSGVATIPENATEAKKQKANVKEKLKYCFCSVRNSAMEKVPHLQPTHSSTDFHISSFRLVRVYFVVRFHEYGCDLYLVALVTALSGSSR